MKTRPYEQLLLGQYFNTAVAFETYWNLNGKFYWKSKHNGWVDWIHDKWNSGLIDIDDYRYLIGVEFEETP
jgi:hypothetical protein